MRTEVPMSVIIVTVRVGTVTVIVTVTSSLVHVNSCDLKLLLVTLKQEQ
jgi:hypothetical protein